MAMEIMEGHYSKILHAARELGIDLIIVIKLRMEENDNVDTYLGRIIGLAVSIYPRNLMTVCLHI